MRARAGWARAAGGGALVIGLATLAVLAAVGDADHDANRDARPGAGARADSAGPARRLPATPAAPRPHQAIPPLERIDPSAATGAADLGAETDEERELAALLRAELAEAWAESFPDRPLSPARLAALAEALLDLRAARTRLATLPLDAAHAAERAELTLDLGEAARRFERVAGMSVDTFTAAVEGGAGLTREETDGARSSDEAR